MGCNCVFNAWIIFAVVMTSNMRLHTPNSNKGTVLLSTPTISKYGATNVMKNYKPKSKPSLKKALSLFR